MLNKIPNSDSFEDKDELIDYIAKTLNSSFFPKTNKKIDETDFDFLTNPVNLQYISTSTAITANVGVQFQTKVVDSRNNGHNQSTSFVFVCPKNALYSVGLFANTSGTTTGAWLAIVTKPSGAVIQYVIGTNALQTICGSRDIYMEKGSKLSIINTVARTVVNFGTAAYNFPELTITQRGI